MPPLVELKNVAQRYGDAAIITEVSLEIHAGEHLALLGPSGSGKSTLLRLIAGLEPPCAGEVWIFGERASLPRRIVLEPHRRKLAMVFQDLALWPNLSAMENVTLGLAGTGLARRDRRERATSALERCGILELSKRRPGQLSGGQQQRVALARALAVQPKLLLLDEPFSGLDLGTRTRLCSEIIQLCAALEITLLLVAHDVLEGTALCKHAVVLEDGRVSETGPFERLFQAPGSETMRTFVAQLPGVLHRSSGSDQGQT